MNERSRLRRGLDGCLACLLYGALLLLGTVLLYDLVIVIWSKLL